MANYNVPGVYIHDLVGRSTQMDSYGTTFSASQEESATGVMLGATRSGLLGEAQKVTSWTEFVEKYSNGLDTPFMENSYLPNSVYGFFQNGGKDLYIVRVAKGATKAKVASSTTNKLHIEASDEGAWGNNLKLEIVKSESYSEEEGSENLVFDVTISLGTSDSVFIPEVMIDTIVPRIIETINWFSVVEFSETVSALGEETITLSNGSDGTTIADEDYISALGAIDYISAVTMVAIPGQTSNTLNSALLKYCDDNSLFPIIDAPVGSTVDDVKNYRKQLNAWTGALAYPWGNITDPLTGNTKLVPTAGHLMGLYARTILDRGVSKAPAGTNAVVQGFISTETKLTQNDISTLNPLGIICIITKPNLGIVCWGARSLNSTDSTMKYVTDGLLNLNIKHTLYANTEFAVYEPNTETLWKIVETACLSYLESLRQKGALVGESEKAYYVIVDSSINTEASIAENILNIEVGYAPVKPAEFVVIKLSHSLQN